MAKKENNKNVIIGLVIGVLVLALVGAGWYIYSLPRIMDHGPAGFDQQRQVMDGMRIDSQIEEGAFSVVLDLSQQAKSGEEIELIATVTSNTAPHSRAVLTFFVDDDEIESMEGLIPPYQTSEAKITWLAESGEHKIKAVVSSAAGVVYDEDEKNISVS